MNIPVDVDNPTRAKLWSFADSIDGVANNLLASPLPESVNGVKDEIFHLIVNCATNIRQIVAEQGKSER